MYNNNNNNNDHRVNHHISPVYIQPSIAYNCLCVYHMHLGRYIVAYYTAVVVIKTSSCGVHKRSAATAVINLHYMACVSRTCRRRPNGVCGVHLYTCTFYIKPTYYYTSTCVIMCVEKNSKRSQLRMKCHYNMGRRITHTHRC